MSLEESSLNLSGLSGEHNHNHLLSSQEAGWNKLSLIYELEPAGEMPETIALAHVLVVAQGEFQASFHIEEQWHQEEYLQGDVALIPAGTVFPRVAVDRDVPLINLFLPPDVLVNAMGDDTQLELRSQLKVHDPLIQQIALALKTELVTAGEDSQLYADSMATALGVHLLRRYGVNNAVKEYRGGLSNYQLKIVTEYIQGHLDHILNLDLLASLVNISPHYFACLFKQSTGTSPHKYITSCRLAKAKLLLRQNLAIAFVCQEVGFKNQSHFTRVFRQHYQITPKAYQNLF
ncbi:helix-turn-helix transcriptional regulator [Pleurocapsa sp. CCALA 161]|uniref:helix-turn-helix transcriptional regulator n=1 Tax=Pleurocapsa sp. CCALA 161 TaxID=2107688 RepID=UPI0018ECAD6C|nr:AraC family transcriptional regulator [Pleurocapsa sp. CCALA 161]